MAPGKNYQERKKPKTIFQLLDYIEDEFKYDPELEDTIKEGLRQIFNKIEEFKKFKPKK